jgi:hypothetical protein
VDIATGALDTTAKPALQALIQLIAVLSYENSVLTDYFTYVNTSQPFTKTPYTPLQVCKVERKDVDEMNHLHAIVTHLRIRDK